MSNDVCRSGEDILFLAYCAVSKDFRLLVEGTILPRYMSESCAIIAEWILQRRTTRPEQWPPSYQALQEQFPEISWPNVDDLIGLDPELPANDLLHSYQKYMVGLINASTYSLLRADLYGEDRPALLSTLNYRVEELRQLTLPTGSSFSIGEDVGQLSRALFGDNRKGKTNFSQLTSDMSWLRKCCEPFEEGIYSIFARPKDGKSFLTQCVVDYWAYQQDQKVLLVDPENSTTLILQRLMARRMEIHWQAVRKLEMHLTRGVELTSDMERAVDLYPDIERHFKSNPRIHVLGKDRIDPKYLGFTIEQIIDAAASAGVDIIAAEQVHKYTDPSANPRMSEAMKAHRAITAMANRPGYLWWASTQQNRESKASSGKIPRPSDEGVFGSDALAQNALFLANVWKVDLADNKDADLCTWVWMISPLLNRNQSSESSYFIRFRPFDYYEELDPLEGRALCEARLAEIKQEYEQAQKRGRQMLKDGGAGTPSDAGMDLVRQKTSQPISAAGRWKNVTKD